jgi:hypothetical protein
MKEMKWEEFKETEKTKFISKNESSLNQFLEDNDIE